MALVFAVVLGLLILEVAMSRRQPKPTSPAPASLALLHTLPPHAAGIDVGAAEVWVCVPPGAVSIPRPPPVLPVHVRRFGVCTADLQAIAAWLHQCGVTTGAMASTGVYGIPLYDLLEPAGFEVLLVDPRQVPRAPNRPTTDVHDCQWIQRLHRLGLLPAACRPEEPIRVWRSYPRHRARLIEDAGRHLQRLEKALEPRNVKWPEVGSDLTGLTGRRIVRARVRGERAPKELAKRRDPRCKARAEPMARALQGTWQPEHLCAFQQSLALYDSDHEQIRDGDRVIEAHRTGMA
jgi:transposase